MEDGLQKGLNLFLKMEEKKKLLDKISELGFRYIQDPKTIFVGPNTQEDDLPSEVKELRNKYKFMIQTEIR